MHLKPRLTAIVMGALTFVAAAGCTDTGDDASADESFSSTVLAAGLSNPWEILVGPDERLWVTERTAGRVTQVDLEDGATETVLEIPDVLITEGAQDGLLGMALHPGLLTGEQDQFVYLSYVYDAGAAAEPERRAKIVRYAYDADARRLGDPVELLTGLPASIDHNAGRLVFGPDANLYYTIGDQGNNQFSRFCEPIEAQRLPTEDEVRSQDWSAYQGKVLRIAPDGSIPPDNPVVDGVQSHVYTYGHRNPQGLVFDLDGRLFSSEHGPKSDDELNLIEPGGNYGWPHVAGHADDRAYAYADWSAAAECESLEHDNFTVPESVPQHEESTFDDPAFTPPLRTYFTVDDDHDFRDPTCARMHFICWPTLAPAGLEFHGADDAASDWGDSLLMPSLKYGTIYRLPLDGDTIGEPVAMWETVNRYRDVAAGAEPGVFYVATDSGGMARGADGAPTDLLEDPGSILVFTLTEQD